VGSLLILEEVTFFVGNAMGMYSGIGRLGSMGKDRVILQEEKGPISYACIAMMPIRLR